NQKITTLWDEMEKVGLHPLRCLYWHKTNPPTNPRKNFCSSVEVAVFARKPGKIIHWGGGGTTHNFFQCPKVYWGHKIHKTQKPVPLMQWLVKLTTPIGGTILDPFAGGGTTGVAAGEEGMNFVGMENDQEAYDKAKVRLGVA
ncbi:MAG TPA: DNA methyltransferase, partial [Ktedonobacteraceae bacterium]|nr:DNA methyltransferase [Ktedonobacteraceae bacterium]